MVKWLVGQAPEDGTLVCRFPPENGAHALDKLPQPIEIRKKEKKQEIELEVGADIRRGFPPRKGQQQQQPTRRVVETESWEICDKDGRVRFSGPTQESTNAWFIVKEVITRNNGKEYHVTRADQWINFSTRTAAIESAPDLDESERIMKEARAKAKLEFNEYLKQKRKKPEEIGIAVPSKLVGEDDTDAPDKTNARNKLVFKRARGLVDGDDNEFAESSVAYVGKSGGEVDGEWEGEEAFSDDDELVVDEANADTELNIDVEEDDVEKDHEGRDHEDLDTLAEELFKNALGSEIKQLMEGEQGRESVEEEELDDELRKYASDLGPEDEMEEEGETAPGKRTPTPSAAPLARKQASKEDQIRARVKGMFWRNDNKLKPKDVLSQFPGIHKASEEYQYLTKALRDLADIQADVLVLKQQFRK